MPFRKWSEFKRDKLSPERIERIEREARELASRMRGPFAYEWESGQRGVVGHPEQHGLAGGLVDVLEIEPTRLHVTDGERKAWVPREIVGLPEDFGIVDDTSYVLARERDQDG